MSTLSVRLPNSLHRHLKDWAVRDGVSMNQLISSAVGEKLAALMTVDYLQQRAARGTRRAYEDALRRVADVAPEPGDALPDKRKRMSHGRARRRR